MVHFIGLHEHVYLKLKKKNTSRTLSEGEKRWVLLCTLPCVSLPLTLSVYMSVSTRHASQNRNVSTRIIAYQNKCAGVT